MVEAAPMRRSACSGCLASVVGLLIVLLLTATNPAEAHSLLQFRPDERPPVVAVPRTPIPDRNFSAPGSRNPHTTNRLVSSDLRPVAEGVAITGSALGYPNHPPIIADYQQVAGGSYQGSWLSQRPITAVISDH